MKEIKSANGEIELQMPEYANGGPVRVDTTARQMADIVRHLDILHTRILTLEAQVTSLQCSAPKGIPKP